jgi:hypothetical protein
MNYRAVSCLAMTEKEPCMTRKATTTELLFCLHEEFHTMAEKCIVNLQNINNGVQKRQRAKLYNHLSAILK